MRLQAGNNVSMLTDNSYIEAASARCALAEHVHVASA